MTSNQISGSGVLARAKVVTRLPAADLERARRWYREVLELEPVEERPGGLRYVCAGGEFVVYASAGRSEGTFTQVSFTVDDHAEAVATLRARGVTFEEYDVPGLQTVDGVTEVAGNYPSTGAAGERAAWFRDSEGNLIGLGQPVR
jgi:catechol 2,3-dioxygenase-like lactoylglutathione lyase family enzyme